MTAHRHRSNSGFVLPFVLASLVVIALALSMAYRAVERGVGQIDEFRGFLEAERAFLSGEAIATYTFLTGDSAPGGLWFGCPRFTLDPTASYDESDFSPSLRLNGRGGGLRFSVAQTPVFMEYRDGGGYFPINRATEPSLRAYLETVGLSRDGARSLAPKILDYRDVDSTRRFQGGERADYRLAQLPQPSNSDLRDYTELLQVLGARQHISNELLPIIARTAIFGGGSSTLNVIFALPELRAITQNENLRAAASSSEFSTVSVFSRTNQPGQVARFTMATPAPTGGIVRRVIEMERNTGDVPRPVSRSWIYDESVPAVRDFNTTFENARSAFDLFANAAPCRG